VLNVLVTGAAGFMGRNLMEALHRQEGIVLSAWDLDSTPSEVEHSLRHADLIFHLAGVNRPRDAAEFAAGNAGFTASLCDRLRGLGRRPKIVFTSSIQACLENPYGESKRQAESRLREYATASAAEVAIYRLPNVFGKWCRPNYNSVVATFCHHIARSLPIQITDPDRLLELVYIDDLVACFLGELTAGPGGASYQQVPVSHQITLGQLADQLRSFQISRTSLVMPDLAEPLARKLYATYLSYLPEDGFSYPLLQRRDERGVLAEFIKSPHFGQIFVSRTRPGITRGHHYHHTKVEKFLVLDGEAVIRFRHIESEQILEYRVTGRDLIVVDVPPGYTHSIENVGPREMTVLFWASEIFDSQRADTHYKKVA